MNHTSKAARRTVLARAGLCTSVGGPDVQIHRAIRRVTDTLSARDEDKMVWDRSLPLATALMWAANAGVEDDIVSGTAAWAENIVWGSSLVGYFNDQSIISGTRLRNGTLSEDNLVWSTADNEDNVIRTTGNRINALGMLVGGAL